MRSLMSTESPVSRRTACLYHSKLSLASCAGYGFFSSQHSDILPPSLVVTLPSYYEDALHHGALDSTESNGCCCSSNGV